MPSVVMNRIRASSFRHEHTVLVGRSPFSGKVQESDQLDWVWRGKFEYAPMLRAECAALLAEIKASVAAKTPLRVYDPDFYAALSGFTGAGNINGAGQTGTSINITVTYPVPAPSQTVAKAGDKVWVRDAGTVFQMFELLADVVTNASSQAVMMIDAGARIPLGNTWPLVFGVNAGYMTPSLPARVVEWSETPTDTQGRSVITLSFEELV